MLCMPAPENNIIGDDTEEMNFNAPLKAELREIRKVSMFVRRLGGSVLQFFNRKCWIL